MGSEPEPAELHPDTTYETKFLVTKIQVVSANGKNEIIRDRPIQVDIGVAPENYITYYDPAKRITHNLIHYKDPSDVYDPKYIHWTSIFDEDICYRAARVSEDGESGIQINIPNPPSTMYLQFDDGEERLRVMQVIKAEINNTRKLV